MFGFQALAMQQMYANYMNQYMQYLQSVGMMGNWPASVTQSFVQTMNNNENNVEDGAILANQVNNPPVFDQVAAAAVAGAVAVRPQAEQQQQQQHQQEPQAHQEQPQQPNVNGGGDNMPNVMLNAGAGGIGAMEDDEDMNGGQRDVLDWFYVASRVLVFLTIVYFNSSLSRFALAAGLGIVIYLNNIGFFGNILGNGNNNNNNNNNNEQQAAVEEVRQQNEAHDNHDGDREQDGDGEQREGVQAEVEPVEPPAPHPLSVMATFVTTFFTSLLPNDAQVV